MKFTSPPLVGLVKAMALSLGLFASFAAGCSAGTIGPGGGTGATASDSDDGTAGTGGSDNNSTDIGADLGADFGSSGGTGGDCVKLATWGALGTYGAVPGMDGQDAITAWLNEYSTGEAEYFATKPTITAKYSRAIKSSSCKT